MTDALEAPVAADAVIWVTSASPAPWLRDSGLARAIGVSVQTLADALPVIETGLIDAVQVPISLQSLEAAQPMLRAAQQAGIGVIAREVLRDAEAR